MSLYRNFHSLMAFIAIWFVFTVVVVVSYGVFADSHGWKLVELTSLLALMFGFAGVIMVFAYLPQINKDLCHATTLQSTVVGILNSLDHQDNHSHEQFVLAVVVEKMLPAADFSRGTFTEVSAGVRAKLSVYVNALILKEEHGYGLLIKDYSRYPELLGRISRLKQLALALQDSHESLKNNWQQPISEIR